MIIFLFLYKFNSMPSIKFLLKEPNADKSTPVLAVMRFKNKRLMYSIGLSIHPNLWDSDAQRAFEKNSDDLHDIGIVLSRVDINDNRTINNRINRYISHFSKTFSNYEFNHITPSLQMVKSDFDVEFRGEEMVVDETITLNDFIDKFIDDIKSGNRTTSNGTRYSKGTIKNYEGFKNIFNEFQEDKNRKYNFDDIDLDFYQAYSKYLNDKDYSPNTKGRHIKSLKVLMGASQLLGLHQNNQYKLKEFRVIKEGVKNIYLSLEELENLYNVDLTSKKEMEAARDVFLIGCFTALRYSDYSRLKPHHIATTASGTRVIRIKTKKTGDEVIIPFWHWMLDELIAKYPDGVPKTHEQKVNTLIKKVGAKAGIKESVTKVIYKGGDKFEVQVPKCDMIKTHSARRSGASNMYLNGIPNLAIMKITGHKTEKDFMNYIKVSKEESAERIIKDHRINKPLEVAN